MREASRIFAEQLHIMGAKHGRVIDCGGLASTTTAARPTSRTSVNYTPPLSTRCHIVSEISEACTAKGVPHPDIVTESGRARNRPTTPCSSSTCWVEPESHRPDPRTGGADEHRIIQKAPRGSRLCFRRKNFQESYHDALQLKEEAVTAFTLGVLGLRERARVEQLFWALCEKTPLKIVRDLPYVPDDLEALEKQLSDNHRPQLLALPSPCPITPAANQLSNTRN